MYSIVIRVWIYVVRVLEFLYDIICFKELLVEWLTTNHWSCPMSVPKVHFYIHLIIGQFMAGRQQCFAILTPLPQISHCALSGIATANFNPSMMRAMWWTTKGWDYIVRRLRGSGADTATILDSCVQTSDVSRKWVSETTHYIVLFYLNKLFSTFFNVTMCIVDNHIV